MKTAKEILHDKAAQYNDGFMTGQVKWIVEAMEEYAKLRTEDLEFEIQMLKEQVTIGIQESEKYQQ